MTCITPEAPLLAPPLKWTGGKSGELDRILRAMPAHYDHYVEPFCGGAALFFALPIGPAQLNDTSPDLIALYRRLATAEAELAVALESFVTAWEAIDVAAVELAPELGARLAHRHPIRTAAIDRLALALDPFARALGDVHPASVADDLSKRLADRIRRLHALEERESRRLDETAWQDNLHATAKATLYYLARDGYNARRRRGGDPCPRRSACYVVLKELAYAAMWRTSRRGDFNVPFGGLSYARKNLRAKVRHLTGAAIRAKLEAARIDRGDFTAALLDPAIGPETFVFLDPPYDSRFRAYDDAAFGAADQTRLAEALQRLDASWMLVIQATPLIERLYDHPRLHVSRADKLYGVEYKGRNRQARAVEHLMITNYAPPASASPAVPAPAAPPPAPAIA